MFKKVSLLLLSMVLVASVLISCSQRVEVDPHAAGREPVLPVVIASMNVVQWEVFYRSAVGGELGFLRCLLGHGHSWHQCSQARFCRPSSSNCGSVKGAESIKNYRLDRL